LSLLEPDAENIETSDKPEEQAPAATEGVADAENGKAAPDGGLQTSSEDKPQEAATDTVTEAPPQQQGGDATGAAQETTRLIEVPNTKVRLVAYVRSYVWFCFIC
jgi:hypothetical protein